MSKTRKTGQKYKLVAILFNTWFNESIGCKLKIIRNLINNHEDSIARYCNSKDLLKLKLYYNAFENFREYWYTNPKIEEYEDAWLWFEEFALDPAGCLTDVMTNASKVELKWLKDRIQHPDHRCDDMGNWKIKYLKKCDQIGIYEVSDLEYDENEE